MEELPKRHLNYISKNKSQESFDNNSHQVNVNKPLDEITEMSRMENFTDHMLSSSRNPLTSKLY